MISICWSRPLLRVGKTVIKQETATSLTPDGQCREGHMEEWIQTVPATSQESPGAGIAALHKRGSPRQKHPNSTPRYMSAPPQLSPGPSGNWAELRAQTSRQRKTWHFPGMATREPRQTARGNVPSEVTLLHLGRDQSSAACLSLNSASCHQNHSGKARILAPLQLATR